jgi:hypothetical protein
VALIRRDPVTLHPFPGSGPTQRFHGRHATAGLFRSLQSLAAGGETPLLAATNDALMRPGPPGLTVVISDLFTADWPDALRRLPARGGDVVVIHVLSDDDLHPTMVGDVELVDGETGRSIPVSATRSMLEAYERRAEAWMLDIAARARHAGATVQQVMANDDVESVLLRGWREGGVLR